MGNYCRRFSPRFSLWSNCIWRSKTREKCVRGGGNFDFQMEHWLGLMTFVAAAAALIARLLLLLPHNQIRFFSAHSTEFRSKKNQSWILPIGEKIWSGNFIHSKWRQGKLILKCFWILVALVSILNRTGAFVSPKRHHINFLGGSKLGDIHGKSSTFSVKNILEDFVSTEIRTRDGWIKDFLFNY